MSLADSLAELAGRPKGPPCTLIRIYASLTKSDAEALHAYMADVNVSSEAIWDALKMEGYQIAAVTVRRHRNRRCLCDVV